MVTQSHALLKEDENHRRPVSEPNWKNFCGKRHEGNAWETKAT